MDPIIVLFRQDLRLKDNPALTYACETGHPIIPIYVLDDAIAGKWKMGKASRWWLHHSLKSLNKSLGFKLNFFKGSTEEIISRLIKKYRVSAVYANRCYEPYALRLQNEFNGSLLFEPWEISNKQNEPFKVFTPFWKRCMEVESIEQPLPAPKITIYPIESETLDSLKLLQGKNYDWEVGEKAALSKLKRFNPKSYEHDRDFPALDATSKLSPHLHFGEVSPRQVFNAVKDEKFRSEIGWREFSYYQLYHFPQLPEKPWHQEFSKFPWKMNATYLKKWQNGETGYPIVDAGMRQLLETGWMHNRVRMICASFLVKDLFLPWQVGAEWFWDKLVDADLANNSASWQWVAGCGFDAAPFFRIFNPTLQAEKFDPEGIYIKQWAPDTCSPIINHNEARKKALEAFKKL